MQKYRLSPESIFVALRVAELVDKSVLPVVFICIVAAFFEALTLFSLILYVRVVVEGADVVAGSVPNFLTWFSNEANLLYWFSAVFLIIFLISTIMRSLAIWIKEGWIQNARKTLSLKAFKKISEMPYLDLVGKNTNDLSARAISEVDEIVKHIFLPLVELATHLSTLILLISSLIYLSPITSGFIITIFLSFYVLVSVIIRPYLRRLGRHREDANTSRFMTGGEFLGGLKTIKIAGSQSYFLNTFAESATRLSFILRRQEFITKTPRYYLELLVGLLTVTSLVFYSPDSVLSLSGEAIGLFVGYLYAGFRILPSSQAIYLNLALLEFIKESAQDFVNLQSVQHLGSSAAPESDVNKMSSEHMIEIDAVSFSYSVDQPAILDDVSLVINEGERVGIVGKTGSGKSTLLHLMLGLFSPTKGRIKSSISNACSVDNEDWRDGIAYVSQELFLFDASLAENVALGVERDAIDSVRVERMLELVALGDFASNRKGDIWADIGQNGALLSGGQRQRVVLARALYNNSKLLFLDEATSALDRDTEIKILTRLREACPDLTVVMITHREDSLRFCDRVFEVKGGSVLERNNMLVGAKV